MGNKENKKTEKKRREDDEGNEERVSGAAGAAAAWRTCAGRREAGRHAGYPKPEGGRVCVCLSSPSSSSSSSSSLSGSSSSACVYAFGSSSLYPPPPSYFFITTPPVLLLLLLLLLLRRRRRPGLRQPPVAAEAVCRVSMAWSELQGVMAVHQGARLGLFRPCYLVFEARKVAHVCVLTHLVHLHVSITPFMAALAVGSVGSRPVARIFLR